MQWKLPQVGESCVAYSLITNFMDNGSVFKILKNLKHTEWKNHKYLEQKIYKN